MAATKNTRKKTIPISVKRNVIYYFHNNKNNSTPVLMKEFNLSKGAVNWILDEYLNKTVKPKA